MQSKKFRHNQFDKCPDGRQGQVYFTLNSRENGNNTFQKVLLVKLGVNVLTRALNKFNSKVLNGS